ncbi:MAG: 30S ribosomal protein S6 [bacterium]
MSITEDHEEGISGLPAGRQVYELSYLLLPSIPEENLPAVVTSLQNIIEKAGGQIFDSEAPFKRGLAYQMSKIVGASNYIVKEAYIGWLKFDDSPSKIAEINIAVEAIPEVLRFLLVKAPRETVFTFASTRVIEETPIEESGVTEEQSLDTDLGFDTESIDSDDVVLE